MQYYLDSYQNDNKKKLIINIVMGKPNNYLLIILIYKLLSIKMGKYRKVQ